MGGREPRGFQSVMDKPDLVRRVIPPTWTIPATRPEVPMIHFATGAYGFRGVEVSKGRPFRMSVIAAVLVAISSIGTSESLALVC